MKLAIAGQIRSGKNTLADYFINKGCVPFAFAEGISHVIDMYFPEARKQGKPRQHYQVIGQSFRQLNPNIWVEWTDGDLQDHYNCWPEVPVVITDLRQPNEVKYCQDNGFTIIKVEAALEVRQQRAQAAGDIFDDSTWFHETESHIATMPYNYLVTNNGTLDELYVQADFIYSEVTNNVRP